MALFSIQKNQKMCLALMYLLRYILFMSSIKPLTPRSYENELGKSPVEEWVFDLSPEDADAVVKKIDMVALKPTIGLPHRRSIKSQKGLWEIRVDLSDGKIGRILYCTHKGYMVLLHGFIKKSQKTPEREISTAKDRMKDFMS